jgi:hypothetical protein
MRERGRRRVSEMPTCTLFCDDSGGTTAVAPRSSVLQGKRQTHCCSVPHLLFSSFLLVDLAYFGSFLEPDPPLRKISCKSFVRAYSNSYLSMHFYLRP